MDCVMCTYVLSISLPHSLTSSYDMWVCNNIWQFYKRIYSLTFTLTTKHHKITFKSHSTSTFCFVSRFLLPMNVYLLLVSETNGIYLVDVTTIEFDYLSSLAAIALNKTDKQHIDIHWLFIWSFNCCGLLDFHFYCCCFPCGRINFSDCLRL